MGNTFSEQPEHLYILRQTNLDLPLCPFLHTITHCNSQPVGHVEPQRFRELLQEGPLRFDVMDVRDRSTFAIVVPQGTGRLGLNVIKLKGPVSIFGIRVTCPYEGCPFLLDDQIIGIENLFFETEDALIEYITTTTGVAVTFIVARGQEFISVPWTLSGALHCDIETGLFYQPPWEDYRMHGYTGAIVRENASQRARSGPQTEQTQGTSGVPTDSAAVDTAAKHQALSGCEKEDGTEDVRSHAPSQQIDEVNARSLVDDAETTVGDARESITLPEHSARTAEKDLVQRNEADSAYAEPIHTEAAHAALQGTLVADVPTAVILENRFVPSNSIVEKGDGIQIQESAGQPPLRHSQETAGKTLTNEENAQQHPPANVADELAITEPASEPDRSVQSAFYMSTSPEPSEENQRGSQIEAAQQEDKAAERPPSQTPQDIAQTTNTTLSASDRHSKSSEAEPAPAPAPLESAGETISEAAQCSQAASTNNEGESEHSSVAASLAAHFKTIRISSSEEEAAAEANGASSLVNSPITEALSFEDNDDPLPFFAKKE